MTSIRSSSVRAVVLGIVFLLDAMSAIGAAAPATQPARATIDIDPEAREMSVWPEIIGINLDYGGRAALSKPEAMQAVKSIGIKSIRFPNGCEADRFDWKADNKSKMTVEQFLDFCDAVGAEPYYTINMQGGTEGLQGPPPAGADVAEIIRYRHLAPNPCGYTDYYFGTLPETLDLVRRYTIERAMAGKRPILCYEMGNENWGQGTTDWPPEHYAATVAAYAQAMRKVVADAAVEHARLKDLKLWITAVGYPLMGNNQDPMKAINHDVNLRWTREVNRLHEAGLIDAVQDHFYPYSADGTDLLIWSHHNLQSILYARRGEPNPNLGGYLDEAVAYRMPIEITEWNLKCWGHQRKTDLAAQNLGFEQDMSGWTISARTDDAKAAVMKEAGRHGTGLRLQTGASAESSVTVAQVFDWKGGKAKRLHGAVWVRTPEPGRLTAQLATVSADGSLGEPLPETGRGTAWRTGHWHKIIFGGTVPEGATRLAVGFVLTGAGFRADVDNVELYYWNEGGNLAPVSVDAAAQQLFLVDAIRIMIAQGIRRAHLHHLFGAYPCGIMYPDGRTKDSYKVFQFYAGGLGTQTVRAEVACDKFDFDSQVDRLATDFNALAPDVKAVPVMSALAMRDEHSLYVVLVNRSLDEPVELTLRAKGRKLGAGFVRTLTCTDVDLPGVELNSRDLPAGPEPGYLMAPHSACLFKLSLDAGPR